MCVYSCSWARCYTKLTVFPPHPPRIKPIAITIIIITTLLHEWTTAATSRWGGAAGSCFPRFLVDRQQSPALGIGRTARHSVTTTGHLTRSDQSECPDLYGHTFFGRSGAFIMWYCDRRRPNDSRARRFRLYTYLCLLLLSPFRRTVPVVVFFCLWFFFFSLIEFEYFWIRVRP